MRARNPSTREFENHGEGQTRPYLLNEGTVEERLNDQLTYFDRPYYEHFFKKIEILFEGENQRLLRWNRNCWEKVGRARVIRARLFKYCSQSWHTRT